MIYSNEKLIWKTVKKAKNHGSFVVSLQTANIMAIVHNKCSVKTDNVLNLWEEDINRKCVFIYGSVLHKKALSLQRL
jgi:hypothetical protein